MGQCPNWQKTSILGKYKIKWDIVPLDPPSFIKSWDKVPTFVNILSKYKISWDIVPTDPLYTLCSTVANKGLLC